MLILGHAGITLGAAAILCGTLRSSRFSKTKGDSSQAVPALNYSPSGKASWLISLGRYIDIRLPLIGSLLPDIIDKPVGMLFFRGTFSQSKVFSHTLLFLILVTLTGLYLHQRYSKGWLLVLSFGTFTHLIFDQMWLIPQTLFWPFLGFTFERSDLTDWVPNIFYVLLTNLETYVPELVGVVILLWFGLVLVRRRKVFVFVRYGRVW